MNKHKVGRPFDFPDSYIEFLSFLKVGFDIPYRMVEGAVDALSEYISFIHDICFTQIRRRMVRLMKGKKPSEIIVQAHDDDKEEEDPITVVVDSTGLTTTNKGSYIEDKWKKEKRKFIKLHIMADRKTKKIRGLSSDERAHRRFEEVYPSRQGSVKEKEDREGIRRHDVRFQEELQSPEGEGNRARNQGQEECEDASQRLSPAKRGNRTHKEARSRRLEAAQGLRAEVDRRDSLLILQESARRGSPLEEIHLPEG